MGQACRRILSDTPDAEDAFQATFLALARKAGQLRREPLAGWLHRVARRAAMDVEAGVRRRRALEQRLRAVKQSEAEGGSASRAELYAVLDEELAGLPERLRVPLMLRYLESKTQDEVARILGCSRSVALKRLARGEALLRERLERRGLAVGVVSVGALLGSVAGASALPAGLIGTTVRAALRSFAFPLVPYTSASVAEGVMKTVLVTKKMKMVMVLLGLTVCLGGGGVLAYQALAGNTAERPQLAGEPRREAEALHKQNVNKGEAVRVDCYGDPLPEGAVARLGTVRLRHLGCVYSVVFSPDGKTVASGGDDGTVCLWEAITGKQIRILRGHQVTHKYKGGVTSVVFSSDGKTVASGGRDGTARLWDATTGKEIRTLKKRTSEVHAVAFSFDGKTMASWDNVGMACLRDVSTGKEIRTLQVYKGEINSVAFSSDLKTVASAGDDGIVRLWEVATGKEIRTLKGHLGWVQSVAFSSDSRILASGGRDCTVRLWDTATGKEIRTMRGEGVVHSVVFSSDGRTMASGEWSGTVHLWKVSTGKLIRTLQGQGIHGCVRSVAFSPDGKIVASGAEDDTVRVGTMCLWEVATGKGIQTLKGHRAPVCSIAFSSDGRTVASGGHQDTVCLWDAITGKEIRTLKGRQGISAIISVAFSPDGKTLASGSNDHTVRLWDVATGKEMRTLKGYKDRVIHPFCQSSPLCASEGGCIGKEAIRGRPFLISVARPDPAVVEFP